MKVAHAMAIYFSAGVGLPGCSSDGVKILPGPCPLLVEELSQDELPDVDIAEFTGTWMTTPPEQLPSLPPLEFELVDVSWSRPWESQRTDPLADTASCQDVQPRILRTGVAVVRFDGIESTTGFQAALTLGLGGNEGPVGWSIPDGGLTTDDPDVVSAIDQYLATEIGPNNSLDPNSLGFRFAGELGSEDLQYVMNFRSESTDAVSGSALQGMATPLD